MPVNVRDSQDVYKGIGESVIFSTLQLKRADAAAERAAVRDFAGLVPAVLRSLKIRCPGDRLKVAVGFGSDAWDRLFPGRPKPRQLEPFAGLGAGAVAMPATAGDIFIHVRAQTEAVVYEVVSQIMGPLRAAVDVLDETHGFGYFEGRAIIGFIDGTEGPDQDEAPEHALVGDEDPGFANGSYAFAQRWIHDLEDWNSRSTEEQERQIGRAKFSDLELDDEAKAANAHNVVSQDNEGGVEHKIVRMNVPFAEPARNLAGTYFIGYSSDWAVTKRMLTSMVDNSDALFSFSRVETGALFFVPAKSLLAQIADGEF
ncbi:MAG: Dyp-type peroxidase [Propionibacteriaceae bacterium]|jgi:putative iron-dependent peroxidase|nr:Dyp-type peroxidase [Propionibacteriaceae bacterium]